ncbi:ABC transporter permease [Brevundimonas naejangsanensis]|uniref:ABC transporter permease n=1 Tax=Brevundimonas naejangsanensis TaxID=588932 RepID=A0A494RIV9_9CAUL|nr:ABC transporter permease [Brevundimonas naejangsanensis]AYG93922.1 ABC transporter permease [Brevundimonas naejangsanensis]
MSGPVRLIAEREFRTYVATASFWIALLVGPVLMALAAGLLAASAAPTAPAPIHVVADAPALARVTAAALEEVVGLDGRAAVVRIGPPPASPTPPLTIQVRRTGPAEVELAQSGAPALGPLPWRLLTRTVERDVARGVLAASPPPRPEAAPPPGDSPPSVGAAAALGRFALVLTLWMTLTGSLGMLLQAVVRERGNRSLESLLASVRPMQIVLGKVVGVGAVSLLVLGAWLGSAAALAMLAPGVRQAGGAGLADSLGDPVSLVRAAAIYLLAFAFYGLLTVAVGARARDAASAQNLTRPLFGLLLATFFVALAVPLGAGDRLDWLLWVPPFTPFVLLTKAPGALPLVQEVAACVLLAIGAVLAGRAAAQGLAAQPIERRRQIIGRRAEDRDPASIP